MSTDFTWEPVYRSAASMPDAYDDLDADDRATLAAWLRERQPRPSLSANCSRCATMTAHSDLGDGRTACDACGLFVGASDDESVLAGVAWAAGALAMIALVAWACVRFTN